MKLTICSREVTRPGEPQWAIHAENCRDIAKKEVPINNAHLDTKEFPTTDAAVAYVLDDDVKELGYTTEHVKVYPCCKG